MVLLPVRKPGARAPGLPPHGSGHYFRFPDPGCRVTDRTDVPGRGPDREKSAGPQGTGRNAAHGLLPLPGGHLQLHPWTRPPATHRAPQHRSAVAAAPRRPREVPRRRRRSWESTRSSAHVHPAWTGRSFRHALSVPARCPGIRRSVRPGFARRRAGRVRNAPPPRPDPVGRVRVRAAHARHGRTDDGVGRPEDLRVLQGLEADVAWGVDHCSASGADRDGGGHRRRAAGSHGAPWPCPPAGGPGGRRGRGCQRGPAWPRGSDSRGPEHGADRTSDRADAPPNGPECQESGLRGTTGSSSCP